MDILISNIHWVWIAAGILLVTIEMMAPGAFLLWFGFSAIATGAIVVAFDPSLDYQVLIFSVLSIVSTVTYWKLFKSKKPNLEAKTEDGYVLNKAGAELVGKEVLVTKTIENGSGRVKAYDTSIRAEGPDVAAGERVRIVSMNAGVAKVEVI